MMKKLEPEGWKAPSGYANGIEAEGRFVFVAGQVGWGADGRMVAPDLAGQVRQALGNVASVLACANARVNHIARMTWYVVDIDEYRRERRAIGEAYREIMGDHYPAMTLVQVTGLAEPDARVEIEATAVIPAR